MDCLGLLPWQGCKAHSCLPQSHRFTVRDLNKNPTLPFLDASFDCVVCGKLVSSISSSPDCAQPPKTPRTSYLSTRRTRTQLHPALSIDYFTRPLSVLKEVGRVLRPGAMVVITFSNRLFIQKVSLGAVGGSGYGRDRLLRWR